MAHDLTPLEERVSQLAISTTFSATQIFVAIHRLQLYRAKNHKPPAPELLIADLLEPATKLSTAANLPLGFVLIELDTVTNP